MFGANKKADGVLLIAPTRGVMQKMLDKCEDYADKHNNMIRMSKTKCCFVSGDKKRNSRPASISLIGRELPWISTDTPLGQELSETGSMEHDAKAK